MPATTGSSSSRPYKRVAAGLTAVALASGVRATPQTRESATPPGGSPVPRTEPAPPAPVSAAEETFFVVEPTVPPGTGPAPNPPTPAAGSGSAAPADRPDLLPVFVSPSVNTTRQADTLLLREGRERWLATPEDLRDWGLTPLSPPPDKSYRGQDYYYLDTYPGFGALFDAAQQEVAFSFAPAAFRGGTVNFENTIARPARPGYGAYLNYDVLASADRLGYSGYRDPAVRGLAEGVVFTPYGRLENLFSSSDLLYRYEAVDGQRRFSRVNSSFVTDFPERRASLVLGDTVGVGGIGGAPLRLGGVRYGTNFGTQPGFVTSPVLAFTGQAAAPSVADLYIDGVRQRQLQLPAGAFELNNIPVVNGEGEAQLVVTDALGRQQVFTRSFITTARLLRAGLDSYSFELGRLRRFDGGLGSDRYGSLVGVAEWQRGLTDNLTGETRLAASNAVRNYGASVTVGSPLLGVYGLGLAGSQGRAGNGGLVLASAQKTFLGRFSFSGNVQLASEGYRSVGTTEDALPTTSATVPIGSGTVPPAGGVGIGGTAGGGTVLPATIYLGMPRRTYALSAGFYFPGFPNANITYIVQEPRDRIRTTSLTATMSKAFGPLYLSLNAVRNKAFFVDTAVYLTAGYAFGSQAYGSTTLRYDRPTGRDAQLTGQAQLARSISNEEEGVGWNLLFDGGQLRGNSSTDTGTTTRGGAVWNTSVAALSADLAHTDGNNAWRLGAAGAVIAIGETPFFSRPVTQSLAYVDEPLLAGLPVYVNGRKTVVLDAEGRGVLPVLTPYARNLIRVDLSEAPASLVTAAPDVSLVPFARAGYRANLGVAREYGAILRLVDADTGLPVAAGTRVTVDSAPEDAYVADQGEAYVVARRLGALHVLVRGPQHLCKFDITMPEPGETLTKLGPLPCASLPKP